MIKRMSRFDSLDHKLTLGSLLSLLSGESVELFANFHDSEIVDSLAESGVITLVEDKRSLEYRFGEVKFRLNLKSE
jgi:hypothetical protein